METVRSRLVLNYGIVEHYFLFISLIFAFIVNDMLAGVVFIIKEYNNVKPNTIHVIWIALFFLFIIQCWWGTLRTKNIINNSFSTIITVILQPFFLYALCATLFPEKIDTTYNYNNYFINYYPWIYLAASFNISYLIILNRYIVRTVSYPSENRIRFIAMCSFITMSLVGIINKYVHEYFASEIMINVQLVHVIACGILLLYFIKKYRNTISDFEYLDPKHFLEKIMPCIDHAIRRKDAIAFIIIKTKKFDDKLFDEVRKITRMHDEKCLYCNYIFIFLTINDKKQFHEEYNNRLAPIKDYMHCDRYIANKIYEYDYSQYDQLSHNEKNKVNENIKRSVIRLFGELKSEIDNINCFATHCDHGQQIVSN